MGRQLFRKSYKQRVSAGDTDQVVASMPIPAGGMLANVWGEIHSVPSVNLTKIRACLYAVAGYIIPYYDDTKSLSVDTLWDQKVPKDADLSIAAGTDSIDTTPETTDALSFFDAGQANLNKMFNIGGQPERIYHNERLLTVASRGQAEFVASSEADLWQPTDVVRIRIKDNFRVEQPSYVMFAVGNPELNDVSTGNETTLSAIQEVMLNNLELAIQLALPQIVGMTEAGAESPFADLATLIELLVEPIVEEETANSFAGQTWTHFAKFTFEVQLAPDISKGPISG